MEKKFRLSKDDFVVQGRLCAEVVRFVVRGGCAQLCAQRRMVVRGGCALGWALCLWAVVRPRSRGYAHGCALWLCAWLCA